MKPGLTGWAQVHGFRAQTDIDSMTRRVDLDPWYTDNWSIWLDAKIVVKTMQLLVRGPAAY